MKVYLKQVDNFSLAAKAESNHWLAIDERVEDGGNGAATGPMELMLISVASCSAMDVISILKKRRVVNILLEIEVEGDRRDEHPRIYTNIHLKYIVTGKDIKEKDVARAIRLSEDKYCSAIAMVKNTAKMSSEYIINNL